jgi:hypothetical protein
MSETGWPLIPRELLPAPVKPARRSRPAEGDGRPASGRQLSIFGAETTEPSPADLAGLLTGPGRLQRMGGTARIIVSVDAGWRVHVLMNELVRRGLVVSWHPLATGAPVTRSVGERAPATRSADEPAPALGRPATRPAASDRRPVPLPGGPIFPDDDLLDYDVGGDDEPAGAAIGGGGRAAAAGMELGDVGADIPSLEDVARTRSGEITTEPDGIEPPDQSDESEETDDSGESGAIAAQWHVPLPQFEVRTAYSSRLNALARSWPEAAGGLFLSGPRMRLWVAAAGYPADDGFRLALTADQDPDVVDAALVRAGLAGSVADDRRSYLIIGKRRLARLAELVGQRPAEAPPEVWPGGVPA